MFPLASRTYLCIFVGCGSDGTRYMDGIGQAKLSPGTCSVLSRPVYLSRLRCTPCRSMPLL